MKVRKLLTKLIILQRDARILKQEPGFEEQYEHEKAQKEYQKC